MKKESLSGPLPALVLSGFSDRQKKQKKKKKRKKTERQKTIIYITCQQCRCSEADVLKLIRISFISFLERFLRRFFSELRIRLKRIGDFFSKWILRSCIYNKYHTGLVKEHPRASLIFEFGMG